MFKTGRGVSSVLLLMAAMMVWEGQAADQWWPMPLVTQGILAAGHVPGGEGGQRPQMVAIDGTDGSFILYGTDVGGLFRSVDGGKIFVPANVGIEACGIVGLAIDPRNKNRALAIGDGGGNQYNIYGGVHLTTNQGQTWSRKLGRWLDGVGHGRQNGRDQVAYDPVSFDATAGYCKTAYWVSEDDRQDAGGSLWRSSDGGETWSKRCEKAQYGGADDADTLLAVHPTSGVVYLANKNGFYRSSDGGATFAKVQTGAVRSLAVAPAEPNAVWTSIGSTLYKSTDSGVTFQTMTTSGIANIHNLKVCPINPQRMQASNSGEDNKPYSSLNGGATWTVCAKDMALSFIPPSILQNSRCCSRAWHPTNPKVLWATGPGDILSKSTDGGATLKWAANGINNIMIGSSFNFNSQNPDIVYLGFQDYNGARTTNSGKTWEFINLSKNSSDGDAWGWVYGGYAASASVMFGGNKPYNSGACNLWITFDGGITTVKKVDKLGGIRVAYGDPVDGHVFFCWNQRSEDAGTNWTAMTECAGVFTHDPVTKALYGAKGSNVVRSTDKGATWQVVAQLPANVADVARDAANDRLWLAAGNKLYRCDGPRYDQTEVKTSSTVHSVAVDPKNPQRLFVAGGPGTWRKGGNAVSHSKDGGATWSALCNRTDLGYDGGNCGSWVRVHPVTGRAWVGTCCYGMWQFGK